MDRTQGYEAGGFNTGSLHSPPPTRRNWDDATTDIPLHETGSPHVQFAAKSPSIIPSPVYANSPSMPSGSVVASPATLPPPLPMHTSSTTTDYPSGPSSSTTARNFGADTFNHNGGEKVAVEHEDSNMGYAMYERNNNAAAAAAVNNQPTYYGNTGLRSDGFMRLESQEDDLQQTRDGGAAAAAYKDGHYPQQPMPQQGTSYVPYLQQPAMMDSAGRRNLGMRLLLGPVRRPWFSWISGLAMLIVLVVEFVKNSQMTGSVIETSPTFNPMIGPSYTVLINMGARFTPCMRPVPNYSPSTAISYCYREQETCTLEELCGFGGFGGSDPDQSFRFITPIFMHAGVVHYVMNMLSHLRLGADLECVLGAPRYILLYMASGIYGFVLSAMLAQTTTASMGCSGALFGLIGYMFIDVLVNWKTIANPVRELIKLLMVTIISLVLGLLPGLDNFAHLGGFVVGIVMGAMIAPMREGLAKKGKLITWGIRAVAFIILIILFAVSITSFYSSSDPSQICPGCKYLSCLPVNNWCDI